MLPAFRWRLCFGDVRCSDNFRSIRGLNYLIEMVVVFVFQVESSCNANIGCVSDVGSLSCGPYQIKQAYYSDCGSPGSGTYLYSV